MDPATAAKAAFSPRFEKVFSALNVEQNDRLEEENASNFTLQSLQDYVRTRGGTHPISRILIANNGIAAVKAIRSIRKWAYETFNNDRVIEFVVMATPEDLKANAAYIHLADEFVQVPGGTNNNNYANIQLITDIAERTGAHAVWAGWGHASENPKLPEMLSATKNKVVWIGPPPSAMRALGDKIGSTIIAQTARVPCMPWSGDGLTVDYRTEGIPVHLYNKACVNTAAEAREVSDRIGYPVMIKASEGGGGKGIRRVTESDQIDLAFGQVKGEVPGSPIFIMKLAPTCRHLEVQLLADSHNEAIAVFGRDCSIQRRHQKIIEEGPVVAAPPPVWREMEKAAVRLAKEVGYVGAGTVEYLYLESGEYYFLELNPRLQVEHPVTELISGVNLPAAQLQIAMGIPLHLIRGIRRMYGERPDTVTPIDFDKREASTLPGHVIACRITAENPDSEFQPTSGVIQELNFRSTPDVWGYFSVAAKGIVHEYSDSQFGHMFALGETREIARRNMVLALKELSIRGDIRTTIEYLRKILETEDFRKNNISTTWLEVVLKERIVTTEKPDTHLAVLHGALFRVIKLQSNREKEFNEILARGQMPSGALHHDLVEVNVDLIYQKTKYVIKVAKSGPNSYDLFFNNWRGSAEAHTLSDDGLLVLMDAKKHVVYGQEFPSGLRLTVDGKTCLFETEYDPSSLRAAMAGKLVRYIVPDGGHVDKDKPYAEVEVMKMYITLTSPESGYVQRIKPEGGVLEAGDLIATLTLDDTARIKKAELYSGSFPPMRPPQISSDSPHQQLKNAHHNLQMLLSGFVVAADSVSKFVTDMMSAMRDPRLPLEQFREILSNLSGRIPQQLYDDFSDILQTYHQHISNHRFYWESPESFPVLDLQNAIDRQLLLVDDAAKATLLSQLTASGVSSLLDSFKNGNHTYAVQVLSALFDDFFNVEYMFCSEERPEYVIKSLRKLHKDDLAPVMRYARAHYLVKRRSDLVNSLLDIIETQLNPLVGAFLPILRRLALLSSKETANVALKARSLIMRQHLPSNTQRRIAVETILNNASACTGELRKERLAPLIDQCQPIEDLIFPFMESKRPAIQTVAMETYIRRLYQVYNITSVDVALHKEHGGIVLGRWEFYMSQSSVRKEDDADSGKVSPTQSPTSFSRSNQFHERSSSGPSPHPIPSPTSSMSRRQHDEYLLRKIDSVANISLVNAAEESERDNGFQLQRPAHSHPCRTGVMVLFKDFDNLKQGWEDILIEFDSVVSFAEPVHVLYLGFHWRGRMPSDDNLAQYFQTFLQPHIELLQAKGIRTVTFVTNQESKEDYPLYFTYRYQLKYEEDPLIRHIEPSYALHMQLQKLQNFDLRYIPTSNRLVHLFAGYPASQPGAGVPLHGTVANPMQERKLDVGTPYDGRRVFARSIVRKLDSGLLFKWTDTDDMDLDAHPEAEVAFLEALNSVEIAIGSDTKVWKFNSIFLNILAEVSIDPSYIEAVVRLLARRYSDKIRRLNIATVEFAINIKPQPDAPMPIAYRFFCTNPTAHALVVDMYQERRDPVTGKITFKYIRKPTDKEDLKSYWEGLDIYTPYPVQTRFQKQRDMASNLDTIYVYDIIPILEHAISKGWRHRDRSATLRDRRSRAHSMEMPWTLRMLRGEKTGEDRPSNLLTWSELILQPGDNGGWTLVQSKRAPGQNDIGMVAWVCTLVTPECPNGRDIVIISNDITHQAGTFGPMEDVLFDLASKYARERRIPRIYFAANSGARIGLAEELRHKFKVAWTSEDPTAGFQYLYLAPDDYEQLKDSLVAEPVVVDGETRYIIRDIIGKKDGLGVESLRGSGMIAGETSLAYDEIFTLTYVTGRTVGIGAYLSRLGQRVIQKASPAQPMILTGFNALNKLLGSAVYTSNLQLGGPEIMYTNGTSHLTSSDDMDGFLQILQWLSFVAVHRQGISPVLTSLQPDPVDRRIGYRPPKGAPYDPRLLITGQITENGQWLSGFFDRDSWFEVLGGWAKTVVVGRARLGGYPFGVIAVETRQIEQVLPADPADPNSKETVLQRAGQVWFPDSAWKTAQAIKDCQAEDIPLFVFANWRGFSGGMKDMFEEILKFGSYIVDSLRTYRQPIFIYIPPNGTLRGGAWVVVDQTINLQFMEMYSDPTGRGGVMETEGTMDVKFRKKDILIQAHRLDSKLQALDAELKAFGSGSTNDRSREVIVKEIRAREELIYPTYYSIATQFTDMHDTPGRMIAKGCLQDTVDWEHARTYFYYRLQHRLIELRVCKRIESAMIDVNENNWKPALKIFRDWVQTEAASSNSLDAVKEDRTFCEWYATHSANFEQFFSEWSSTQHIERTLQLLKQDPSTVTKSDDLTVENLIAVIKRLNPEQQKRLEEAFGR